MKTNDARFLSKDSRESLRKRVVNAVIEQGIKQRHAARLFGVCAFSVSKWVRKYKAEGEPGLATKAIGAPPTGGRLKHERWLEFQKLIMTKTPGELGLPFTMWDRKAIRELLSTRFNVSLCLTGISSLLKKMGFSPQRPMYSAIQRNDDKVQKWLNEDYPSIKKRHRKKAGKSISATKQK